MISGQHIFLRALEPTDIDLLYSWENDTVNWQVSNTISPFSKHLLQEYINSSNQDIYVTKQLRLVICRKADNVAVGLIDLFDFDVNNRKAGVGILIGNEADRKRGYAYEALSLLKAYSFDTLGLHQLFCNIVTTNTPSLKLFEKSGFKIAGTKREWVRSGQNYLDEYFLQCIAS